jgi:uncharacterized protein (DUF2225 family)
MAPFLRIQCPRCNTVFEVTKMLYDEGPESLIYCPLCMTRWPRREGKVIAANFPLGTEA